MNTYVDAQKYSLTLLVVVKGWKQPLHPSAGERLNCELSTSHGTIAQKTEINPVTRATTWINLKRILLDGKAGPLG